MEKVSNNIKVPAIIALVLQGNIVLSELIVLIFQKQFIPLYLSYSFSSDVKAYPPGVILSVLQLVIYIVFVYMVFNYAGDRRRVAGIVLMAISLGLMALSYPVNYVYSIIVGHTKGAEYIAVQSAVQGMSSALTFFTGFGASPLFFVACGRYGISKKSQ